MKYNKDITIEEAMIARDMFLNERTEARAKRDDLLRRCDELSSESGVRSKKYEVSIFDTEDFILECDEMIRVLDEIIEEKKREVKCREL